MLEHYSRALRAVLGGSALPYGYTISLWSTGAAVMSRHGPPKVSFVFLFALGAIAGFALVAAFARTATSRPLEPAATDLLATGVLHVVAVAAAIGAAALIAQIGAEVAWPLASFAATGIYLVLASLKLMLVHRHAGSR